MSGNLIRRSVVCLIALGISAFAGCALSPQTVAVEPSLAVDAGDIGHGRTVALNAIDSRTNKTLGTRGGVYSESSSISTATGVQAALRQAMADALTTLGFSVADAGTPADMTMTISLDDLSYLAKGDPVVDSVEVGAKVSSVVARGSETFKGTAGASKTRQVLTAPSQVDNEAYINEILAISLEKLLADKRFADFVK
ncbi:MAG: YajG family lipoprotein [Gammaproteobacteria bacterium]